MLSFLELVYASFARVSGSVLKNSHTDQSHQKAGKMISLTRLWSRCYSINHYQNLGVPRSAKESDIKKRFRELSKKYHPDIMSTENMNEDEKKASNDKFISFVESYEILKDRKKRADYDKQNPMGTSDYDRSRERRDFQKKYYGQSNTYTATSGLNTSRNRVHYGNEMNRGQNHNTYFSGEWRDHSVNNDVPHFDYTKHLEKNINIDKRFKHTRLTSKTNSTVNPNIEKYFHNKKFSTHSTQHQKQFHRHFTSSGHQDGTGFQQPITFKAFGLMAIFGSASYLTSDEGDNNH